MRKLNDLAKAGALLFVFDASDSVIGTLTDGDIRRGLLGDLNMTDSVTSFMNPNFRFMLEADRNTQKIKELKAQLIRYVPLLDANKKLLDVLDLSTYSAMLPLDAIIMAGGMGKRLLPLTENIPKPLLKVGEKAILDHNLDRLSSFGISQFHISVNYLGEKIKNHVGTGAERNSSVHYITETEPLGTIGAARLVKSFLHPEILIMNSDLLTNIDFEDFYRVFSDSNAEMAVATIPYHVDIPYAVMEIEGTNDVRFFKEKPRYTYYSNAGIYLLKKEVLKLIPSNKKFDATDLMDILIKEKRKLISYPILSYWLDIGKMEDYQKAQADIQHLKL